MIVGSKEPPARDPRRLETPATPAAAGAHRTKSVESDMIRTLRFGTLALLVAGVVLATATRSARGDDDEKVKAEKLAKAKKAGEAVESYLKGKSKAADIAKAHDLVFVMHAFTPTAKGGLGAGDGYWVRLKNLASKKAPSAKTLEADAPDLIRLAEVTRGVAEIVEAYPVPPKDKDKNPTKNWVKYNKEMKQASLDFIEAVKGMKPDEVKMAGAALNNTCVRCHREFMEE
jgi:hypothetical protein